ncbi:hypothetical protein BCR37DRAFT_378606 [Protomyces lactucae-debilis]|uniref:Sequence orphan n=1 Tax=Protomyces lactucae-debilis TaxID=2754530 RepID=A0A1Y2FI69_PROLT|nr:uncharacterized protein BCR37DRAFT_378606 [Protomyces lactucae-debilis]ORY83639.1 hypothetical protein BCR37DRAFT_378606 [Protomyces lactucae-debilis]
MAKEHRARLPSRLTVDLLSAAAASATISPIICIIDRSIIEATSGKSPSIIQSMKTSTRHLIRSPVSFLTSLPFLLLYGVYFATYATANVFDTIQTRAVPEWSKQTNGFGKFIATTAVNLSACVYKDVHYAKLFGTGQPRPLPLASYGLFSARDSLTIFASFNVPSLLAPYIGLNVAQLTVPCAMQLFSTPMHLLGLDVYNRPGPSIPIASRWQEVKKRYWKSTAARIMRILPAFGVAGIVNRDVRRRGMSMIQ